jgi:hypothetical protein
MNNHQNINQNPEQIRQKDIEARLKNYTSPEGVTTKQLEIGLWFVEHKLLLRKILYGFLILIAAVSWSYSIYGFAYYLSRGMNDDAISAKLLVATNTIGHDYVVEVGAKPISIAQVGVLKSTNIKYDFYAQIRNDNAKWWAEFDYYFSAAGLETPKAKGFILPSGTKYLLALAQDFSFEPAQVQLVMENIGWHRIDQHKIPDWNAFYQDHLNIASADIKFTPSSANLQSEKLNLNQLSFSVINHSAYNYWDAGFVILLHSGEGLANVNYYTLSDFMSGQKRPVEISWPGDLAWVDTVEIIPEINIMKDDIYIKYEGGAGQPK